ncbi:uncharacterized protein LOC133039424 [Cannabis sativa]|uniref:uncharacterized protein LOC133039424 n=1 Tax=Cannabis sativa TaxID=3483 RepID=UPI0029C9D805|nr:uncharacterized protein LOC133039424 [Cannabis sativa]
MWPPMRLALCEDFNQNEEIQENVFLKYLIIRYIWRSGAIYGSLHEVSSRQLPSFPLLNVNIGNGKDHWTKPLFTKLKINVDGAIFESETRFGFGFIVRDSVGKLILAASGSKLGAVSPEIAEVVGMKEVLSWIKRMNVTDVEIETDSLVTVQAINGSVQIPSQFGLIVQDCRLLLSELQNVFISFVKRSANRAAHCLARQSCFMSDCMFDEFSAPSNLLSIVRDDIISS